MGALRDELLAGVAGDVVDVGAGNGMNFSHDPATTARVVAVKPEPHLRSLAEQTAARAAVPVTVLPGRAEALPLASRSVNVGVISLMLCAVTDQSRALSELFRVIRPGGELRFLEHVAAGGLVLRHSETGGCNHLAPVDRRMPDSAGSGCCDLGGRLPSRSVSAAAVPGFVDAGAGGAHVLGKAARPGS